MFRRLLAQLLWDSAIVIAIGTTDLPILGTTWTGAPCAPRELHEHGAGGRSIRTEPEKLRAMASQPVRCLYMSSLPAWLKRTLTLTTYCTALSYSNNVKHFCCHDYHP